MHAFDVLGDPVRRRVLELLADGELSSGAITAVVQAEFGISQPAVSQHLAKLRLAGLITQRRAGRHVLSRARDHHVGELLGVLVHDAEHRRSMTGHPFGGP